MALPPTNFIVNDTSSGSTYVSQGTKYTGPVGVNNQYIVQTDNPTLTPDNLNITAITPNVFIHSGSGLAHLIHGNIPQLPYRRNPRRFRLLRCGTICHKPITHKLLI